MLIDKDIKDAYWKMKHIVARAEFGDIQFYTIMVVFILI